MEYSIFDTHCDTLCKLLDEGGDFSENKYHIDLRRMNEYKSYTQVMACFLDPQYRRRAKKRTIQLIKTYKKAVKQNTFANTETILSIEGADAIKNTRNLRRFYKLGVRLIALVWNHTNQLAAGAHETDANKGLTPLGEKIISEMNKLKILLDVSHLNDKSFYEAIEITTLPIVASHSCAGAVCNNRRNLTDDMFKIIAASGGCVGINIYPKFLSSSYPAGIDDITRHIEHFMSIGGENSIGIGSDFDGVDYLPCGIRGCEDLYKIFDRLLQLNYSEETVNKISHGNFRRVFDSIKQDIEKSAIL